MGRITRAAGLVNPFNRAAVALFAWRHRGEISNWAGYAARSAPRLLAGNTADVYAEGRLRARLTADSRTRDVSGLQIEVEDGVARLSGAVDPETADAVREIAHNEPHIRKIRDELTKPRGRRRAKN